MRRRAVPFWLAACLALAAPAAASDRSAFRTNFEELRQQDAYLQRVGWRLLTGNAPFCEHTALNIGLLLQDAEAYSDPEATREVNAIDGDVFVHAVVPDSPAHSGGLGPKMEILAIDDLALSTFPLDPRRTWLRAVQLNERIAESLTDDRVVRLTVAGQPDPVELRGVPACSSHFELLSGRDTASANGMRVAIGREFPGLSYPEEEFAAALAHELAHNILGHPGWLKERGRKRRDIRATEREADRLMPWLLANAGYDPSAAVRFMERWGPRHGGGLFRKRTHDGWDERVELIAAELPRIAASIQTSGAADWHGHFSRRPESPSASD